MKAKVILIIILCITIQVNHAQNAFIGSEGFGSITRGAYGGNTEPRILIVDNLGDAALSTSQNSGTLRWCLQQSYPRIILFNTSGVIELASEIRIGNPYVSLFGQSAPSPGITIKGSSFYIRAHDIVLQHIKIRVGDGPVGVEPKIRDGLSIGDNSFNIIVDHCSFSWGIDENIDIWGIGIHDVTISHCIISEGLYNAGGYSDAHSYGMLVGEQVRNLSLIKNLYTNNLNRNPFIKAYSEAEIINCLIYNSNKPGIDTEQSKVSIVGCVIKPGPRSGYYADYIARIRSDCSENCDFHEIYVRDNISNSSINSGIINESNYEAIVSKPPVWSNICNVWEASSTEAMIIKHCGAFNFDRDKIDKRLINELVQKKGTYITSQNEVGGYENLPVISRDIRQHPSYPAKPHEDDNNNGFRNLEEWLQSLPLTENIMDESNNSQDRIQNELPDFKSHSAYEMVFPNPSSDGYFKVSQSLLELDAKVMVCDLNGILHELHLNKSEGDAVLDLSFLSTGIYLISFIASKKMLTYKVLINKQ